MLKNLLLIFFVFIFASCLKNDVDLNNKKELVNIDNSFVHHHNEMEYLIIYQAQGGISVINLTLDSLKKDFFKKSLENNFECR